MSIAEKMDAAWREMVCARPVRGGDGNIYTAELPTSERFRKAILTATGLTEAQLEGLANGTMVVVRVEPSMTALNEGLNALAKAGAQNLYGWAAGDCWRAMIAAKEG